MVIFGRVLSGGRNKIQNVYEMKMVNIIGYGALGKQFESFVREAYPSVTFTFFDDESTKTNVKPFAEFGNQGKDAVYLIALGYKHLALKAAIVNTIKQNGGSLFTFIHHSAFINPTASLGNGGVVYPMANIDKDVAIGENSIIHNSVVLSHDTVVGNSCYFGPGAIICGDVKVGDNCFIGAGAVISNGVTIGSNAVIGIGTVVTKNVGEAQSVIGNPMTVLKNPLKLI